MTAPVTSGRIKLASRSVENAEAIARACRKAGLSFFNAVALVERESGGKNIYGHDKGGVYTYPDGRDVPVTDRNFFAFLVRVMNGETSNGVGPLQITYAGEKRNGHRDGGYFQMMAEQGLRPWVSEENMFFGFRIFAKLLEKHDGDVAKAGAEYNGGASPNADALRYGRELAAESAEWKRRFRI